MPQGLESMDAIELEMRMRLAELQRRYKEKQKELNRLQLKKDREDDVQNKRGPGRPRKRKLSHGRETPGSKTPGGTSPKPAGKDSSSKRKKLAEKLVDKVFRQSSQQIPSSKRNRTCKALIAPGKMSTVLVKKNMSIPTSTRSGADLIQPATGNIGGRGIHPLKPARKLGQMPTSESPISRVDAWSFNDDSQSLASLRKKSPKLSTKLQKGFACTDKVRSIASSLISSYRTETEDLSESNRSKKKKRKSEEGISLKTPATPTLGSYETRDSEGEGTDILGQGNKKRKPGRPKRCHQNKTFGITETIVARKTKHLTFAQLKEADQRQCQMQKNSLTSGSQLLQKSNTSTDDKFKFNNDTRLKPLYLEEDWCIRRSERIFLNDSSPQPSPNSIRGPAQNTSQQGSLATSGTNMNNTLTKTSTRISRSNSGANPSNITSSGSVTPTALGSSITASTTGTLSAPDSQKPSRTRKVVQKSKEKETKASRKTVSPQRAHMVVTTPTNTTTNSMSSTASTSNVTETSSLAYHSCHTNSTRPSSQNEFSENEGEGSDFSSSDGDNIPLSVLREKAPTPEPRCCTIEKEDLRDGLRVLLFRDGLFYEGEVKAIRPPDVYGVVIDNERGHRPHIYSQEEILKDAVLDVTPGSQKYLSEGTRMCAYWSQQYSCLYPGTISKSSPDPHADKNSVSVEFDDGDTGRIPIDHIRMLPQDFPIASYDQNPILLMGKRRRRTTSEEVDLKKSSSSEAFISRGLSDSKRFSKSKSSNPSYKSSSKSPIRKQQQQAALPPPPPPPPPRPSQVFQFDSAVKSSHKSNVDAKVGVYKALSASSSSSTCIGVSATTANHATSSDNTLTTDSSHCRKSSMNLSSSSSSSSSSYKNVLSSKYSHSSSSKDASSKRKHKRRKDNGLQKHSIDHSHVAEKSLHQKDRLKRKKKSSSASSSSSSAICEIPSASEPPMPLPSSGESLLFVPNIEKTSILPGYCKLATKQSNPHSPFSIIRAASFDFKTKKNLKVLSSSSSSSSTSSSSSSSSLTVDRSATNNNGEKYSSQPPPGNQVASADRNNDCSGVKQKFTEKSHGKDKKAILKNTKSSSSKKKQSEKNGSSESKSKIAAFLPARQLWRWSGKSTKRPGMKGKAKKEFYKAIVREKETIMVGDCAVFLSTGRPHLPYVGSIESLWEGWGGNMVVKVKWFYHPEETKDGKNLLNLKGALFQSTHVDENDVQTISHKCEVLSIADFRSRKFEDNNKMDDCEDIYFLAGSYDPMTTRVTYESGIPGII